LPEKLLFTIQRIYLHDQCPDTLKTYIKFELNKTIGKHLDWDAFLKGRE